ncbi:ATP-binding cassette domain-containing protein [Halorubrum sp. JWXQ-INN 858]|uniref:ABC transporter ATP-binding protein n=1 Tax=Halorubrum sp. JWXQ-INN 858 TaxID=2690782 RepID=UPI00135681B8|nr:ABC transporter ATP-binding protein [Halorubrum sp. JWXQ-INN 858]MWV63267.1 ATP-binding cassette domain-containing protein [Halorubrum sp. JWXQ-INN 858]
MTLLEVNDLRIHYETSAGPVQAVDGVSFSIDEGENLGIVGESGCGKTTLADAILGILEENGYVAGGEIRFKGEDLTELTGAERRRIMWDEISMIPQSAMNALDPVYTVREQILESIFTHRKMSKKEANERVDELFELVGLDPDRADDYPHQFSGGMRQRAMIAMALSLDPALILADEPTTALDVIMQDQILKRISALQDEINSSMMIITHDVSVVAETCDRVVVMYAGKVAEEGPASTIFDKPYHPYSVGLKGAFPNIRKPNQDLVSIPGHPPELVDPPTGCRFADRCPLATDVCYSEDPPEVTDHADDLRTFCHHVDQIDGGFRDRADERATWEETKAAREVSQ